MRSFNLLVSMLLCLFVQAQQSQSSLQDALEHYTEKAGVNFSFDPSAMSLVQVACDTTLYLPNFIDFISLERPLVINQLAENYYTVAFKKHPFRLQLSDSVDSKKIAASFITVLVNGEVLGSGKSDSTGGFTFEYKPKSEDHLQVYALGYNYHELPIRQLINSERLVLKLTPSTIYLDDLIIDDYLTKGISLNPIQQSISIKVSNLLSLPGETDGDIFASLALLPGVSTPDNRPGNLFIRGSSTDQSLILFDNIPIYHRGHYFGTISPYNPKMVESVSVYRSGMHARYGGRVGGAVEINSSSNLTNEPAYGLGLNSLYATGYIKTPVYNKKAGLAIGGRRSFPVSFQSPKLNAISDMVYAATAATQENSYDFNVVYEDYNAKLEVPIKEKTALTFSAIYAGNSTGFIIDKDTIKDPQTSGFENFGVNATLKSKLDDKLQTKTSITWSDYSVHFKSGPSQSSKSQVDLEDLSLNQEFSFGSLQSLSYSAGVELSYQRVSFLYRGELIEPNKAPVAVFNEGDTRAFSASPFFSVLWNSMERLSLEAGLRTTYYSPLDDFALMPRVNANFDLTDYILAKGSLGYYRQYLGQVKYLEFSGSGFDNELWRLADKEIKIIDGRQAMVGFLLAGNAVVLDVEAYQKTANNVNYTQDKRPETGFDYTTADHATYGLDVLLKRNFAEGFDVWSGYSFSKLYLAFDSAENVKYRSKYDQPHIFYFGSSFSRGNFNLSVGWKYASGLYAYSAEIIRAEQSFLQASANRPTPPGRPVPPPVDNPFDDYPRRFKNIHSLDLSASYKLPKTDRRPYLTTFGLSLLNIYDQRNLTDQVTRAAEPSVAILDRNAMRFAPNLMIMVEW